MSELVNQLGGDFYVDEDMVRDAVRRRATFNILHNATMFKIDVFVPGGDELTTVEMSRRRRIQVSESPPGDLFVASAEDIVLQKLIWYVEGGGISDRQWNDLVGVLKVQGPRMDMPYLRHWATRKSLTTLLDRAIAEST